MFSLVAALWLIYLSECFVRWAPGCWVFRPGSPGPFHGRNEPDITFFSGRVGFVWTSALPWALVYRLPPPHDPLLRGHERLDGVPRRVRILQVFSTILFALVMLLLPVLLWMEMFVPWLPVFAIAVITAWAGTLACYFITHQRIYGRMPELESWMMATLSPLALMRAPALVSIDASPSTHPAFAADALCGDEEFLRIARLWHYDMPELRTPLNRLAAQRRPGADICAPPRDNEDDVSVFCPRCHATYLLAAIKCSDCDDVTLQPLPNATRAAVCASSSR
jgi:hypothetical protein